MNKEKIFQFLQENEPLLKLVQPASTLVLALSIFSLPLMIKTSGLQTVSVKGPVQVQGYVGVEGEIQTEAAISGFVDTSTSVSGSVRTDTDVYIPQPLETFACGSKSYC